MGLLHEWEGGKRQAIWNILVLTWQAVDGVFPFRKQQHLDILL